MIVKFALLVSVSLKLAYPNMWTWATALWAYWCLYVVLIMLTVFTIVLFVYAIYMWV
jgi:hypothetical protein